MFEYLSRKGRVKLQKSRRRAEAKKRNRGWGRMLRHETLEDRRVLALVGVALLDFPTVDFDFGTTSYASGSNTFSVAATPTESDTDPVIIGNEGVFLFGTLDFNFQVDSAGNLVGGVPGDDLVLSGVLLPNLSNDLYDGLLLTAEIVAFGSQDSGSTTDQFDFIFTITGGQFTENVGTVGVLLPLNSQFGVTLTSNNSTFTGNFAVDFGGDALGTLGALTPVVGGTSSIHGLVWEDFNNDGVVNFGENAIEGVTIQLLDDTGVVIESTTTDAQGIYSFLELDQGTYGVMELQPLGFVDGLDVVGEIDSLPVGDNSVNDKLTGIVLPNDEMAVNYNFGERPETGGTVVPGQTAELGFWQNKNGQELLGSVNEGLGDWLATTFPNLYGDDGDGDVNPFDLTGKTNLEVAEFFKVEFKRKRKDQPAGPHRLNAHVMATAFAVYVTNSNLAGLTGLDYGFSVTDTGVGTLTINVGDNGEAFGVADGADIAILDALFAVDSFTQEGLLYDDFDMDSIGDGTIDSIEVALREAADEVFKTINSDGSI